MLHRGGNCFGRGVAHRRIPIADADDAAGCGHAFYLLVGQVAVDLARRLHAAMAGYDGAGRRLQDFCDALMAAMRDIDDHALGFHPADNVAAKRGKPALFDTVHRPGKFIVKEMRQPRHAESSGVKLIEIFGFTLKVLQTFDRQHRADRC